VAYLQEKNAGKEAKRIKNLRLYFNGYCPQKRGVTAIPLSTLPGANRITP
jgi:hypothetical protein